MVTHRPTTELTEYETRKVELDSEAARGLIGVAGEKLKIRPAPRDGWWSLTATNHVGTFASGDVQVVVTPKIKPSELVELLIHSTMGMRYRSDLFAYGDTKDLVAAAIAIFARLAQQTFVTGMDNRYVERREPLVAIRGRIDVPRMIARGGVQTPVACRYEELSLDTPRNSLVLAAALAASSASASAAPLSVQSALGTVITMLGDVEPTTDSTASLPPPTRLNAHYDPLLALSRLIMRGTSLRVAAGSREASSFTIDMNQVFEDLVTAGLRRHLRDRKVEGQRRETFGHTNSGRRLVIRPDVLVSDRSGHLTVIDAKYKFDPGAGGRHDDLYQLLAYTTSLGLSEGMLVYARSEGAPRESEVVVRNTTTRIRWRSIDLAGGFDAVDAELAALAASL